MITIALCNNKGGVAKTTSAFNLSGYLGDLGLKVLTVDLDPQGNLTSAFGIDPNTLKGTAYDIMSEYTLMNSKTSDKDLNKYLVQVRDNINLLPSNLSLEKANLNFASELGKENLLKKVLMEAGRFYDVCIIDCSPNLGTLTVNALVSSDYVFIPVKAGIFELGGSAVLAESIETIKATFNEKLQMGGVFLTLYDDRSVINKDISTELKNIFGETLMFSVIRQGIAMVEAIAWNKTIFEYKPKSNIGKDYTEFCKEVMKRTGIQKPRKKRGESK